MGADEPEMTTCPECDIRFYVVWCNRGENDRPCHCPFCGAYVEPAKQSEEDTDDAG